MPVGLPDGPKAQLVVEIGKAHAFTRWRQQSLNIPVARRDPFEKLAFQPRGNCCHTRYNSFMSRQATLNVSLTPTLDGFVRAKVKSGAYESASEVIRESLRLFQAIEKHEQSF